MFRRMFSIEPTTDHPGGGVVAPPAVSPHPPPQGYYRRPPNRRTPPNWSIRNPPPAAPPTTRRLLPAQKPPAFLELPGGTETGDRRPPAPNRRSGAPGLPGKGEISRSTGRVACLCAPVRGSRRNAKK